MSLLLLTDCQAHAEICPQEVARGTRDKGAGETGGRWTQELQSCQSEVAGAQTAYRYTENHLRFTLYILLHGAFFRFTFTLTVCMGSALMDVCVCCLAKEVSVQNRELLQQALEEAQEDLSRRLHIIREIRAFESVPHLRHTFMDETEVN